MIGESGAVEIEASVQPGQLPATTGATAADPGLDADDAAREADQDRGQGGSPRQVPDLSAGGSCRPEEAVRPDSGADRPVEPRLCLGLRLAALPNGSVSRRRASVVRRAGRFRGLRKGEASGVLGLGRDGGGTGGAFSGKIVATVPAGGYPYPLHLNWRPRERPPWERPA